MAQICGHSQARSLLDIVQTTELSDADVELQVPAGVRLGPGVVAGCTGMVMSGNWLQANCLVSGFWSILVGSGLWPLDCGL